MSLIAISTMATASMTASSLIYSSNIIKGLIYLTTDVTKGIYNLMKISNDIDLQNIISKSDIINDIQVIKLFIEEESNINENNKTVISCINNILETLKNLESNISSITTKTNLNKQLWFSYFRSYDVSKEKTNIIFHIDQLKHRFNMLIKIISVMNVKHI